MLYFQLRARKASVSSRERLCVFNSSTGEIPSLFDWAVGSQKVSPNHVEKLAAPKSVGGITSRGKILQSDWLCRNSCNGEQVACRQCTRPSPARVAISRIEKAWLREASSSLHRASTDALINLS